VLTLANSLTNQNLFFTFSLFLSSSTCYPSQFPTATGQALGIAGRQLVFNFPHSKGNGKNLPVLIWWNSCHYQITSRATLAPIVKRKVEIKSQLASTLAVFLREGVELEIGCPRNNQILFSVRTETNWNSICFVCFSVCFTKPKNIFSVCFGVSDRYRNNQNKQNFLKTNRKNFQKKFGGPPHCKFFIFCSNRNKPKLNLFRLFFGLLFRKTPKFFFPVCFGLFWCYRPVSKQPKKTELMV
jgi:hypothetical protein